MNITLLSYDDGHGGAGRSAFKLHKALIDYGVNSQMRVAKKKSDLYSVIEHTKLSQKIFTKLSNKLDKYVSKLDPNKKNRVQSLGLFPIGLVNEINNSDASVIQLNWINGLISISEISEINKPLVWRLSDMWPFLGTEHYEEDNKSTGWQSGYIESNSITNFSFIDNFIWNKKYKYLNNKNIHIVAPSKWIADCAGRSKLMKDWNISIIPTTLDINQFKPLPQDLSRQILGLPLNCKLILFGAIGGSKDPRKGSEFLIKTLKKYSEKSSNTAVVIFGESKPLNPFNLGMPIYWMGHLNDDISLTLLYNAVDIMIIPSIQDNLPQTGIEAQSCGCPLLTFNSSGLSDLLEHKYTGYLSEKNNIDDMLNGINFLINNPYKIQFKHNARDFAISKWSPSIIIPKYLDLYKKIINN